MQRWLGLISAVICRTSPPPPPPQAPLHKYSMLETNPTGTIKKSFFVKCEIIPALRIKRNAKHRLRAESLLNELKLRAKMSTGSRLLVATLR